MEKKPEALSAWEELILLTVESIERENLTLPEIKVRNQEGWRIEGVGSYKLSPESQAIVRCSPLWRDNYQAELARGVSAEERLKSVVSKKAAELHHLTFEAGLDRSKTGWPVNKGLYSDATGSVRLDAPAFEEVWRNLKTPVPARTQQQAHTR